MVKIHQQFEGSLALDLRYDPTEMPGFRNHAAETISACLQRFSAGDLAVMHMASDMVDREYYFEDEFEARDRYESDMLQQNSESSDSDGSAAPRHSAAGNNPGESEIIARGSGRNPDTNATEPQDSKPSQ